MRLEITIYMFVGSQHVLLRPLDGTIKAKNYCGHDVPIRLCRNELDSRNKALSEGVMHDAGIASGICSANHLF